jgi:hypothetical protein
MIEHKLDVLLFDHQWFFRGSIDGIEYFPQTFIQKPEIKVYGNTVTIGCLELQPFLQIGIGNYNSTGIKFVMAFSYFTGECSCESFDIIAEKKIRGHDDIFL